jgi:hypothetical protein
VLVLLLVLLLLLWGDHTGRQGVHQQHSLWHNLQEDNRRFTPCET